MTTVADLTNPYWDEVLVWAARNPVGQQVLGISRYEQAGLDYPRAADCPPFPFIDAMEVREAMVRRYAWTITAPDTVAFVRTHIGASAVDPFAGSGYWAYLLASSGVDVAASDLHPPDVQHHLVAGEDAVDAVLAADPSRALLLAWPPFGHPIGANTLEAYQGDRMVWCGELDGNCGDGRLRKLVESRWRKVAEHDPASWSGLNDTVEVYDRVSAA